MKRQQRIEIPLQDQKGLFPQPKLPVGRLAVVAVHTLGTFRTPADVEEPEVMLASEGNRVVAIWRAQDRLQVASSTDGGTRFTITPLSVGAAPGTIEGWAWHPQVALGDGLVVIAYVQRRRLLVQTSTDGIRFSAPWIVASAVAESLNNTISERLELLAYSDGGFGIVWVETVGRTDQVKFLRLEPRNFARQSVPESNSLASVPLRRLTLTPVTLSRAAFPSNTPRLVAAGAELRVFFNEDQNPEYVQALASSRDGGRTFERLASLAEGNSGLLGERRTKGEVGGVVKPLTELWPLKTTAPVLLPGRGEYLPTRKPAYREGVPLWVLGPEDPARGLFRGRIRHLALTNDAPARQLTKVWSCVVSPGGAASAPTSFSDYGILALGAGTLGDRAVLVACQKVESGHALIVRWVRGTTPLSDWLLLSPVPSVVRYFKLVPTTRGALLLWIEGLTLRAVPLSAP